MNWEAIGATGEIVGASAVVLSLVYLAIQIRAQNRESRIASMHELVAAQRDSMRVLLEPQVSEDFLAALQDYQAASPSQRLRYTMSVMIVLKMNQDAYRQRLAGRLDEDLWDGFSVQLADLMANESSKLVWESRRHQFDDRFRAFVDDMKPGKKLYA